MMEAYLGERLNMMVQALHAQDGTLPPGLTVQNTYTELRKGSTRKAPLCPIVATAPLDLLHVDFTSIETMMELDKSPRVANVLVFQDHFTKHVLAYVTPDQTVKTVTKFLYGGYISIFGALARCPSDRGTSFSVALLRNCVRSLASNDCGLHPTTPRLMGW